MTVLHTASSYVSVDDTESQMLLEVAPQSPLVGDSPDFPMSGSR